MLELDHVDPVSRGGSNKESNLVTACEDCNSGKNDLLLSDEVRVQFTPEIPHLVSAIAAHALERKFVIQMVHELSTRATTLEEWRGDMWELLGGLDYDKQHPVPIDVLADRAMHATPGIPLAEDQ